MTLSGLALISSCNEKAHAHDKVVHAGHDHAETDDHTAHDHAEDKEAHTGHAQITDDEKEQEKKGEHDHSDHDHSKCGVQIGPKGGRMLTDVPGEVLLHEDGTLSVIFTEGTAIEKIVVLLDNKPLKMTKGSEVKYDTANIKDKLPAKLVISVTIAGKKEVDSFELDLKTCEECSNAEYKCVCDNHDH